MAQTIDQVTATWDNNLQALVGYIQPRGYGRRAVLIAVQGPKSSTLKIYRGYKPELSGLMSSIYPASARTYDAAGGAPIEWRNSEAGVFVWSGGGTSSTATASCNVICEVGD